MRRNGGFTLVELTAVMIIVAILAVFVTAAFDHRVFSTATFAEEVKAQLAYGRKAAIAARRAVIVRVAADNVSLSICPNTPVCGADMPLASPTGEAAFIATAPSGVSLVALPAFSFNAEGVPTSQVIVTVNGAQTHTITIEQGTGYVH